MGAATQWIRKVKIRRMAMVGFAPTAVGESDILGTDHTCRGGDSLAGQWIRNYEPMATPGYAMA